MNGLGTITVVHKFLFEELFSSLRQAEWKTHILLSPKNNEI